ncbi:MAG: hypothetical protein HY080_07230 [Gammaproteobacteria bacterium]|nr:hypothetical protein [Gammaproteobacteria bacterium]
MVLQLSKVALGLRLQVPMEAIERHVAASPRVVGESIAQQVQHYATTQHLGYYPAIDFFLTQAGVDKELIDALENISWIVTGMVRNEIRIRMRPVFSTIQYEALSTLAFTMPTVRPGQNDALVLLSQHFTADVVKVNLNATLIQHFQDENFAEKMTSSLAYRWLQPHFTQMEVTSVKYVG